MVKVCKNDTERILEAFKSGNIDAGDVAFPNFVDEIILKMG